MSKIRVLSIIGTRPEVIKMAPVIKELERRPDEFESIVVLTGQHREMCIPYLELFKISPDYDLSIMEPNQTLDSIVTKILTALPDLLTSSQPDMVLVQGDTTSAFAASLAAFHAKIQVGHVEAGLRTRNKLNPYPEEMNRCLIGTIADLHFAPTQRARDNLIQDGVSESRVIITGNTVIDSLLSVVTDQYEFDDPDLACIDFDTKKVICVTTHRRESFGKPLNNTLVSLRQIVGRYADVEIVLPVHYNPNVRSHINDVLGDTDRIHLIEPLPYEPFVQLLNKSYLVLTDSGGVQEEAPSLGKPVLVLRETTERPEGIAAGTAKMVGTQIDTIMQAVEELIENQDNYRQMANAQNPYGDGTAGIKIVDAIHDYMQCN